MLVYNKSCNTQFEYYVVIFLDNLIHFQHSMHYLFKFRKVNKKKLIASFPIIYTQMTSNIFNFFTSYSQNTSSSYPYSLRRFLRGIHKCRCLSHIHTYFH